MKQAAAALVLATSSCGAPVDSSVDWVVTSHRKLGDAYSDLTIAGADSLIGRNIHLGTPAVSDEDRCERPRFVERRVMAAPFMVTEYALTAGYLGVNASDSIDVLDVLCEGSPWSALGGRVIFTSDVLGLAPWEGRLFIVRPKDG